MPCLHGPDQGNGHGGQQNDRHHPATHGIEYAAHTTEQAPMTDLPAVAGRWEYGHALFCPFPVFLNQTQEFLGNGLFRHIIKQLMQSALQP